MEAMPRNREPVLTPYEFMQEAAKAWKLAGPNSFLGVQPGVQSRVPHSKTPAQLDFDVLHATCNCGIEFAGTTRIG